MPTPQMTLRGRRARRNLVGKIMFAGSLLLVCSVFLVSYINTPPVRGEDLCLTNEPPKALHILLVDKTDRFGDNFSNQIKDLIVEKIKSIQMDERLAIFTIRGKHGKRFPAEISMCNPGRGTDYNQLFYNQKNKESWYQEHYFKPFVKSLDGIIASERASESPILEVIEDITTRPQVQKVKGEKTIILISDMAQNSDQLRFVQNRRLVNVTDNQIQKGITEIAGTKGLRFEEFSFEIYQIEKEYRQPVVDYLKKIWDKIIRNGGGEVAYWGDL